MGLPALKQRFETLTAEAQSRSRQVSHAADVVSITIGKLVRVSNSLVETLQKLRSMLLGGAAELRGLFGVLERQQEASSDIAMCADILAMMKRFRRRIDRPYFADVDGVSVLFGAERLEAMKTSTAADGRTTRRLAKRVREAAEDCEMARLRFVATMDDLMSSLKAMIAKFDASDFQHAYASALGNHSIKRFPKVNAYLAQ